MSLALWIVTTVAFVLYYCHAFSRMLNTRAAQGSDNKRSQIPYLIFVLPVVLPVIGLLVLDGSAFIDRFGYKRAISIQGERKAPSEIAIVGFDSDVKTSYGKEGDRLDWYVPKNTIGLFLNKLADAGAESAYLYFTLFTGDDGRQEATVLTEAMKRIKVILYAEATTAPPYSNPMQGVVTATETIAPAENYRKLAYAVVHPGQTSAEDTALLPLVRNNDSSLNDTLPIAESIARAVSKDAYSNFLATPKENSFYLNYYGTLGKGLDFYSAAALSTMSAEELKKNFAGKVVLLGYRDDLFNPFLAISGEEQIREIEAFHMYDIDRQATAAANLIDHSYIERLPRHYEVSIIAGITLVLSWLLLWAPRKGWISCVVLSAALWLPVIGYYLLTKGHLFFPYLTLAWIVVPYVVMICFVLRFLEENVLSIEVVRKIDCHNN